MWQGAVHPCWSYCTFLRAHAANCARRPGAKSLCSGRASVCWRRQARVQDDAGEVEYVEGLEESDEDVDMEDLAGRFGDDLARGFAGAHGDGEGGSSSDDGGTEGSSSDEGGGGQRSEEREVELELEREVERQPAR